MYTPFALQSGGLDTQSVVIESFSQDYKNKMETFEAYDESMVTAANYQCNIVQTVNNQAPKEEIEVRSRENHDTLTLQQQQTEQMHQVTQIESNIQQKANTVRLPALLDGEYFQVIRVEDTNVTVRCQQCMKLLNGNLKSTGNFLSHVKVIKLLDTLIELSMQIDRMIKKLLDVKS